MKSKILYCSCRIPFIVLILVLVSCSNPAVKKNEIKIGLLKDPTQGWMEPGAVFAVKLINDSGGIEIDGEKYNLKLFIQEMKNVEAEAVVASTLKLINQDSVVAIFGPNFSKQSLPASKIAEKLKIPLLVTYSSHPEITRNKKFVFRMGFNDDFQAKVLADYSKNKLNIERMAVLYEVSDDYSRNLSESFQKRFAELGGVITTSQKYTFDNKEITEELIKKIGETNSQGIFLPNYKVDIFNQLTIIKKLDLKIQVVAGDAAGFIDGKFPFENVYCTGTLETDSVRLNKFLNKFNPSGNYSPHDSTCSISFDGINILVEAIKRANSFNPADIQKSLFNFKPFYGINSVFEYKNSGDPVIGLAICRLSNNSEFILENYYPSAANEITRTKSK